MRNLLENPCWRDIDLGKALPDSPHAVSVSLPRWKDIIAYEEKDPECIQKLNAIYPRFGFNPLVREVSEAALLNSSISYKSAWPYPNRKVIELAVDYCKKKNPHAKLKIEELSDICCLLVDEKSTEYAKDFWQHTGLGISSRQASIALNRQKAFCNNEAKVAKTKVKSRLARIYGCNSNYIQLFPSGMAALYTALSIIEELNPGRKILQIGFPYVDVLKLPNKIYNGSHMILNDSTSEILSFIKNENPAGIIVEIPSNPLLKCIDLEKIYRVAHDNNIPLIIDDTIGSPINVDCLSYADLIFSSLTKTFAGRGDIMAGSLTISPYSRWKEKLQKIMHKNTFAELSDGDSIALLEASKDVEERIYSLNKACSSLAKELKKHHYISRVFHPDGCENYKSLMKPNGGFGCLLSFEIKGGVEPTRRFYDSLRVCKGPSLGTSFTLACPYVLLAHYNELSWAENCGVPSCLIRVSVGLEEPKELWNRFSEALSKCGI